jgi:hypothetical protein
MDFRALTSAKPLSNIRPPARPASAKVAITSTESTIQSVLITSPFVYTALG